MINKKNYHLRRSMIAGLILSLAILSGIFIYQYLQYKEIEPRLVKAYSSGNLKVPFAYKLFSTFSEAEYFFRLYSLNYDQEDFNRYTERIDFLKRSIDSLAALPMENNPLKSKENLHAINNNLSVEFTTLKQQIEQIIVFNKDSLSLIQVTPIVIQEEKRITNPAEVIQKIMRDTLLTNAKQDTIVKKRQGLLKRIFKSQDDTLINKNTNAVLNVHQVDVVQEHISKLITTNEKNYRSNFNNLKNKFALLQSKEKKLILSNYNLLNDLKQGIEQLRELELNQLRSLEKQDFEILRNNTNNFGYQLFTTLTLIFLMTLLIIYYHRNVTSYEKKLKAEKDYAAKVAEEKNSILANISHEIRTPLTSLQGIVTLLKKDSQQLHIDKEIIQSVDYDISVINNTIDDILNISKLENESLDINIDFVSPYELVENIINLHYYQAKNKGIELINENTLTPNLFIKTNAFRFKQVLSNLISNAIKYTNKGQVTVEAKLLKSANTESIFIKVIDTGIGIAEDLKDQVFRKYYTVDKNSKKGFGLGLHISKILAEQINSTLRVESELGVGSTFLFETPIAEKQLRISSKEIDLRIENLPTDIHLVFIDDSRINLFFIQQLFNNKRNIKLFENPEEALEYIQQHPVDFVITDLVMPKCDGWEVLKFIKSNNHFSSIKVIACSAESMLLETKNIDFKYDFDWILKKPIKEQELVECIQHFIK